MIYMCKSYFETIRYVLVQQGVRGFDVFIEVFKNRVSQFYKKKWYDATRNSSKLAVYSTYRYELESGRYLDVLGIRKYFVAVSCLRCHNLRIESGLKACTLCNLYSIEDEFHFLMNCTAYTDLFNKFITPQFSDFPSSYKNLFKLMQSGETICTKDVAVIYIKHLFSEKPLFNII